VHTRGKSPSLPLFTGLAVLAGFALAATAARADSLVSGFPPDRQQGANGQGPLTVVRLNGWPHQPADAARLARLGRTLVAGKKLPSRGQPKQGRGQSAWKAFMGRLVVAAAVMFFPPDMGDTGGGSGESQGGSTGGTSSGTGTGTSGGTGGGTSGGVGGGTLGGVEGGTSGSGGGGGTSGGVGSGTASPPPANAPEPSNLVAGILGLVLAGLVVWRKSRKARAV
jgi:hypothetical protein